jgi:hypothetical protein
MTKIIRTIEATVAGAVVGACLLGAIGGIGGHWVEGALAGLVLGAISGGYAYTGQIHRVTIGAILYALFGCFLGPAVDDYVSVAATCFAPIGAFVGWLGWRFLLALPAGVATTIAIGSLAANRSQDDIQLIAIVSFGAGTVLGVYLGAALERHFRAASGFWPPAFLTETTSND